MLVLIPSMLVLFWLHTLNLDLLEKEGVSITSELSLSLGRPQNASLDSALKRGLEATENMLLGEEKVGEALDGRKVQST